MGKLSKTIDCSKSISRFGGERNIATYLMKVTGMKLQCDKKGNGIAGENRTNLPEN